MTARNRQAFEAAQTLRAEIRALLMSHDPLARPLSPKSIGPKLTRQVAASTIAGHLRAIWAAHSSQTEQPNSGPLSATLPSMEKRRENGSEPETA